MLKWRARRLAGPSRGDTGFVLRRSPEPVVDREQQDDQGIKAVGDEGIAGDQSRLGLQIPNGKDNERVDADECPEQHKPPMGKAGGPVAEGCQPPLGHPGRQHGAREARYREEHHNGGDDAEHQVPEAAEQEAAAHQGAIGDQDDQRRNQRIADRIRERGQHPHPEAGLPDIRVASEYSQQPATHKPAQAGGGEGRHQDAAEISRSDPLSDLRRLVPAFRGSGDAVHDLAELGSSLGPGLGRQQGRRSDQKGIFQDTALRDGDLVEEQIRPLNEQIQPLEPALGDREPLFEGMALARDLFRLRQIACLGRRPQSLDQRADLGNPFVDLCP